MIGSEWVRDPEALGGVAGKKQDQCDYQLSDTRMTNQTVPPNLVWYQSRRPVQRKRECGEPYGKWGARGSCLLLQVAVFAICFLALFPRRNHLDEIYSSIDIFNTYFQCNYIYTSHNYACEMHIKCIEYNELFLYALRESFIIHITYAFFYTISITFWANPLSLNFFSIIHYSHSI